MHCRSVSWRGVSRIAQLKLKTVRSQLASKPGCNEESSLNTQEAHPKVPRLHILETLFSPITGDEYDQDSCVPVLKTQLLKGKDNFRKSTGHRRLSSYTETYVAPNNSTSIDFASVKHVIAMTRIVVTIIMVASRTTVLVSALTTTIGTSSSMMATQANSKRVSFCRSGPGKIVIFGSRDTSH